MALGDNLLAKIEEKTGKKPYEFIALAKDKGFDTNTKPGEFISWLKADFGLGHGYAMALGHFVKNGLEAEKSQ
ncbi:hypothetical protein BH09PAT1_BH09PAT1_2560 [soil metagenome]